MLLRYQKAQRNETNTYAKDMTMKVRTSRQVEMPLKFHASL